MRMRGLLSLVLLLGVCVRAQAAPNLALNPSELGLPSPLASDGGWGGGQDTWDIVDGLKSYPNWAEGLALLWDNQTHQATVTLAANAWFDEVVIWHHSYWPTSPTGLDYWNGAAWVPITYSRLLGSQTDDGPGGLYAGSTSDIYTFNPVFGSAVRFTIPGGSTWNTAPQVLHGWIYEFEVFEAQAVPEPASLLLFASGLAALARWRRHRRN